MRGAHAEHAEYKRGARDFVFDRWRDDWRGLRSRQLTQLPLHLFALQCGAGEMAGGGALTSPTTTPSDSSATSTSLTSKQTLSAGAATTNLPAHTLIYAESLDRALQQTLATVARLQRADETMPAGVPSHALLLPLLTGAVGNKASTRGMDRTEAAETASAAAGGELVREALALLLPPAEGVGSSDNRTDIVAIALPGARPRVAALLVPVHTIPTVLTALRQVAPRRPYATPQAKGKAATACRRGREWLSGLVHDLRTQGTGRFHVRDHICSLSHAGPTAN